MKRIYPISRHRGMNTHQCDEFLNAAVMLTYPDPPFFVPPPSYECGGHWQILHLVYCPMSGVSTEFRKPDNRISARPPGPRGEVARPAGSEHHKQSESTGPSFIRGTPRGNMGQGIFGFLTFLYPYLSFVEGLKSYAWFNFETWSKDFNDFWIRPWLIYKQPFCCLSSLLN